MSFEPMEHKAAGHDGPLQSADGSIFCKPTNEQELEFYNETQDKLVHMSDELDLGSTISDWMPAYYGTLSPGITRELESRQKGEIDESTRLQSEKTKQMMGTGANIALQNVLYGFHQPSVLDIKLGSVLYDESANEDKVERMKKVSKSTTSGSLSFRICGMQTVDCFEGKLPDDIDDVKMKEVTNLETPSGYITFDKFFGRGLNAENVARGLEIFFRYNKLGPKVQDELLQKFVVRLQMLYNCLLDTEIRAVSSSLLFVFENDPERWKTCTDPLIKEQLIEDDDEDDDEDDNDNDADAPLSSLHYIDFAHAKYTPGKGYDEELVTGVESLLAQLELLL